MAPRYAAPSTRVITRPPRSSRFRVWHDQNFSWKLKSSRPCPVERRALMPYTTITPAEAKPVANYKMATRMEGGRLLYTAGQVARDAEGNVLGKGDIRTQARQVFQNVRNVLQAAGGDLSDLLKITTYITR